MKFKLTLVASIIFGISLQGIAQDTLSTQYLAQSDTNYSQEGAPRIQFTLQYKSAVERTAFKNIQGQETLKNRFSAISSYKLGVNLRLSKSFSFITRFSHSFGNELNAFNLKNSKFFPERGLSFNDINRDEYSIGFECGLSYKKALKHNYWLKFAIGLGNNSYNYDYYFGSYSTSYDDFLNSRDYDFVELELENNSTKFFFEVGISKYFIEAKNFNLSLVYESQIAGKYGGKYEMNNEQGFSKGLILNKGNNIGLSLTYMFGRGRRLKKENTTIKKAHALMEKNDSLSYLDAKRIVLNSKKKVWNEKSVLFHVYSGILLTRNRFNGKPLASKSHFATSMSQGIFSEIGIKKNFYLETGYSYDRNAVSEYLSDEPVFEDFVFSSSKFSVGIGYRVFNTFTNKPFLNFRFGGAMSILNNPNSVAISGLGYDNHRPYSYRFEGDKVNNVFPTIYLGIGNDWELSKKLFFSTDIRFNKGFIDVYKIDFSAQPNMNFYTVNGASVNLSFGIKYKFLPKKFI